MEVWRSGWGTPWETQSGTTQQDCQERDLWFFFLWILPVLITFETFGMAMALGLTCFNRWVLLVTGGVAWFMWWMTSGMRNIYCTATMTGKTSVADEKLYVVRKNGAALPSFLEMFLLSGFQPAFGLVILMFNVKTVHGTVISYDRLQLLSDQVFLRCLVIHGFLFWTRGVGANRSGPASEQQQWDSYGTMRSESTPGEINAAED